jgi:hypothetical protein
MVALTTFVVTVTGLLHAGAINLVVKMERRKAARDAS